MNNISKRVILLIPGLLAGYLLIGTLIAFALSIVKVEVTSQTFIGNILLFFLIPAKLINDSYSDLIPLTGNLLLTSWFLVLFAIFALSIYTYRKLS